MTARSRIALGVPPAVAVAFGWVYAGLLGGLETPTSFTHAVLVVGVLCPLMMGESSSRIGSLVLRPQARLLPLLTCLAVGPVLALVLGHYLLQSRPEQATALLLLSALPGSTLAPIWASSSGASRSTAIALTLIGWAIASFVSLPLIAGPHAAVARFVAFRDLALLGVMPLAVGSLLRAVLADAFDSVEHAAMIESLRKTVLHASLTVLLFTSAANKANTLALQEAAANLPALTAVALLYLSLIAVSLLSLGFQQRLSKAAVRAALLSSVTRQTALASMVLPLTVAPARLARANVVPLWALALELLCGTAAVALCGSEWWGASTERLASPDGRPSILPG